MRRPKASVSLRPRISAITSNAKITAVPTFTHPIPHNSFVMSVPSELPPEYPFILVWYTLCLYRAISPTRAWS